MIRTTIRFEEQLFKEARKQAIDLSLPFTDVVNQALRLYIAASQEEKQKTRQVSAGKALRRLIRIRARGPRDLSQRIDDYLYA